MHRSVGFWREGNSFYAKTAKFAKGLFDYDYEHPPSLFELWRTSEDTKPQASGPKPQAHFNRPAPVPEPELELESLQGH